MNKPRRPQLSHDLLSFCEQVVVRHVRYPGGCPNSMLRTAALRRDASDGIYALNAADIAERTLAASGLGGEQQPWYGIGAWRGGTFLDHATDLAAISGFPMRSCIVPANLIAA